MREIKFRAWDGVNKKMDSDCEAHYSYSDVNGCIKCAQDEMGFIVMQYTGLKDKNGKEIYEGDIVKDENRVGWVEYDKSDCGFMVFSKHCFFYGYEGAEFDWEELEVIGNVHEHGHLLTN